MPWSTSQVQGISSASALLGGPRPVKWCVGIALTDTSSFLASLRVSPGGRGEGKRRMNSS